MPTLEATAAPEPAPEVRPGGEGRWVSRLMGLAGWLAAGAAAASVYFLHPATVVEGRDLSRVVLMPGMAALAAGLFGALAWALAKRAGPRMAYHLPGQGTWVRLTAYVAIGAMALFAAVTLHGIPSGKSGWWAPLERWEVLGKVVTLRPVFFPALAVFAGSLFGFYLFANRPGPGGFLVETQAEMRRVSWPPSKEWIGSTIVVIVLMVVTAGFLYVADLGLGRLLQHFRIGF